MATTYLSRTFSTPTSGTTWTINFWVKKSSNGSALNLCSRLVDGSNEDRIRFTSGDALEWSVYKSGGYAGRLVTNRLFRDNSAFYNIVCVWDTTNGTAGDRMRIYVNGVEETSFSTDTNPSLNETSNFNTSGTNYIGSVGTGEYFDGLMSHVHFIDGTAYDASAFGQADANGVWTIKTSPSVTYGNNGFFILKDGNSVTDQSGNSNNWTVASGTLTNTEDNPSNVFATVNPLVPSNISSLSNGNTTLTQSTDASAIATLGFQGGKYYWEVKNSNQQSFTQLVGVLRQARMASSGNAGYNIGTNDGSWSYFIQSNQDNGKAFHNNTLTSVLQTTSANDILQVAVDADVGKIWWGVNGTWVNSGDPANGTNAVYTNLPTDDVLFPAFSNYNAGQFQINFGNGYFGTTAVASAGTNASGIGIFEYDVPTGYTALSTKGLNL
jgi:hypothetical protein